MSFADALGWAALAPMALGLYFAIAAYRGRPELKSPCYASYAVGWWMCFLAQVMEGDPVWAALDGLVAAAYTVAWWRNRRKGRGRRALREIGAKSRARIEAMVRQITPSPIPSPTGG